MFKPKRQSAIPSAGEAEAIAAGALAFLAEEPERLLRFMEATGVEPATLSARAGSAEVLEAALNFLLADESALLTFAAGAGIAPERIAPALAVLQRADHE